MSETRLNPAPEEASGFEPWRRSLNSLHAARQVSFRNIVYATDFSATAERALPYAIEIARRSLGTIHAVHVAAPDVYPGLPPSAWPEMARRNEELRLQKQSQVELELQDLAHEFVVRKGDVAEGVLQVVEETSADLLVMGTHGRTGVAKAVMGSVAEKIFRQAPCPVLAVGPGVHARAPHAAAAELNRILYATDLSLDSLAAARYAISLATDHRADLALLHTIDGVTRAEEDFALETLKRIVPFGARLSSPPSYVVEHGVPAEAILKVSAGMAPDLIVLGARGLEAGLTAATHLSRSTAAQVAAKASCPVLIVHS